ncbi:MAG: iron-sulfur cluster assembly protein [Candidatus Poseidoniales archaeon]|jgi:metal-sulfur cluster biosynthetic enzyme
MNAKQIQSLQRRIFRILKSWKDPHTDVVLADSEQIQGIDVSSEGEVQLAITPQRPHCPCCLFDLRDLREKISATKGVTAVKLLISGVPAAERWTRVLNPS